MPKKVIPKKRDLVTKAQVKKMLQTVTETKVKDIFVSTNPMAGGEIYSHNVTAQILQGTADGQRVGDEIYLKSIEGHIRLYSGIAPNIYYYRIMLLWSGEELNPSTGSLATGGLGATQIFMPNGVAALEVWGNVNYKAVNVIYDQVHVINATISGIREGTYGRFKLPLNQKFKYQAAGSVYGKTKSLYMVVLQIPYKGDVSTDTTVVTAGLSGTCAINYAVNFQDP